MKVNDNAKRLKTYKIKNHDSGKTYSVKAVSYTDAKMKYNKHILEDSITEDAISKFVQNYLSSKKPKTKAEQDEIINFLLERNKITKEDIPKVRSLLKIVKDSLTEDAVIYGEWQENGVWNVNTNDLQETKRELKSAGYKYISHDTNIKGSAHTYTVQYTKDSITEDADKSMGTYNGYSIKQNIDGDIYVLKKSGEKQFFESWKKAHEAIKTGAIKDSITEDALTEVQSNKLYKLLSKLDKYDLYELAYGGPSRGSIGAPKRDLLDDAFYELVDKSLTDVNKALRNYNLKLDSITEDSEFIGDSFLNDWLDVTDFVSKVEKSRKKCASKTVKVTDGEVTVTVKVTDFTRIYVTDLNTNKTALFSTLKHDYKDKLDWRWFLAHQLRYLESMLESGSYIKRLNFKDSFIATDSITEDADIAQNDIKSTYLPEEANADNIQYLGFNEKRKLSFYSYGDRYFVHYDLEGRTEEVDKKTVQKILKKNILGEIDENDVTNKEPQAEEIVSDSFDWKNKQERGDK